MKKKIVMIGIAAMAGVCLWGCGATKDRNTETSDEVAIILRDEEPALAETSGQEMPEVETSIPEEMSESETIKPEILITPIEEIWYTEDGTQELFESVWCKIEVTNEGFDALAKALEEWSDAMYNVVLSTAEEYASWAAEDYSLRENQEYFVSYFDHFSMGVARLDDAVLSLAGGSDSYVGGAHGNYSFVGYTYDVETGEMITLDRLIADDERFEAAAVDRILAVLQEEPYVSSLYSDYESIVRGMFAEDGYLSWYLSEEGIVIPFDPYTVGPYAMAELSVVLPYEEYAQYMAIKYRPE